MFITILKKIYYQIYHCWLLKRQHIYISFPPRFDKNTYFSGYNKIGYNVYLVGSHLGRNTYIGSKSCLPNCEIGSFCSISQDVSIISAQHPSRNFVSSCPIFFSAEKKCGQSFVDKNKFDEYLSVNGRGCIIGNDVWIGNGVKIKGGVTIGDGAIIGMGAVVTKDVEPYTIVGGVPAKLIRYRFTRDQIDFLLEFQWWNRSDEWLRKNVNLFEDIEKFIARYSKEK